MNSQRTIFSQIMELAPRYEFELCIEKYQLNYIPKKFSYWDQFLSMSFAQLTFRESLRDIEICLSALGTKTYQMGFRNRVSRSTLADANNQRDWRIWADYAQILIDRARKLYVKEELDFEFTHTAYALDSSTITLCLTLFPWARYQSDKRAIKLHTQLDLRGSIPSFIHISHGNMADVRFLDQIILEAGALYVMDRGYFDFERFYKFTLHAAFFVTRLKKKILYRRVQIFSRDRFGAIRLDAAIIPLRRSAKKLYPSRLRLIEYFDADKKRTFLFITNNFLLSAQTIADIYRSRWKIELFFKWIKQHLRIKAFFGTSENAVKTQIWIAISVYVLVAILKKQTATKLSLNSVLQAISVCPSEKIHILQAFQRFPDIIIPPTNPNQLNLFDFPTGQ
jgi:transposase